jgi:hypothetical protein
VLDGNTKLVVLLGNIGVGKSTLSKYLRNIQMELGMDAGKQPIYTDGESKIRSKKSDRPKTIIPNVDVDKETGTQVIDCAGFQDKISTDVDLVSGYFNKKILESSKKIKILIVEEVGNLEENANMQSFIQALTRTANLIGDNLDSFKESVCLIASKVADYQSERDVLTIVLKFLEKLKKHLEEERTQAHEKSDDKRVKELERSLTLLMYINTEKKIKFFAAPTDATDSYRRVGLRNFIFTTLTSSKAFEHKFQVTFAPQTVKFIKDKMLEPSKDGMEV